MNNWCVLVSTAVRKWIYSCRTHTLQMPRRFSRLNPNLDFKSAPSRHWEMRAMPDPRSTRERLRMANQEVSDREKMMTDVFVFWSLYWCCVNTQSFLCRRLVSQLRVGSLFLNIKSRFFPFQIWFCDYVWKHSLAVLWWHLVFFNILIVDGIKAVDEIFVYLFLVSVCSLNDMHVCFL